MSLQFAHLTTCLRVNERDMREGVHVVRLDVREMGDLRHLLSEREAEMIHAVDDNMHVLAGRRTDTLFRVDRLADDIIYDNTLRIDLVAQERQEMDAFLHLRRDVRIEEGMVDIRIVETYVAADLLAGLLGIQVLRQEPHAVHLDRIDLLPRLA